VFAVSGEACGMTSAGRSGKRRGDKGSAMTACCVIHKNPCTSTVGASVDASDEEAQHKRSFHQKIQQKDSKVPIFIVIAETFDEIFSTIKTPDNNMRHPTNICGKKKGRRERNPPSATSTFAKQRFPNRSHLDAQTLIINFTATPSPHSQTDTA